MPIKENRSRPGTWTRSRLASQERWSTPSAGAGPATGRPLAGGRETWNEWRSPVHLDRYVRRVYNLDFANPVPADDPAPLLDTLGFYVRARGRTPTSARREPPRVVRRRRWRCARVWTPRGKESSTPAPWAQSVAPMREDALSDVGLAWPLMRRMLLEMGHRLRDTGAIEKGATCSGSAG